jgi:autotransporter-associated beta strand protein
VKRSLVTLTLCCVGLAGVATGQTIRTWTSNSDQRWSRNGNWSGNRPDASNEVALFGSGTQLNPELNANNYTVRGLRFGAGAGSFEVGDDNGSRTLKIGNGSGGFIQNLGINDQIISIANLQFQGDSTLSTAGSGGLWLQSNLTGNNRDLIFEVNGDVDVSGNITTGSGTLTKTGTGDLFLSGTNTYSGLTTIDSGAIILGASGVFSDAAAISILSGASLHLSDLNDVIGRLDGAGAVDFGAAGTGQLTLAGGASTFAGAFLGSGDLVIGAGASLELGADFDNSNFNIVLDGGTLLLSGHSLAVGSLTISANSIIDFGSGTGSVLSVASLGFEAADLTLTAESWADATDYFYSQTGYVQGAAPLDQVEFAGWDVADTKWQSYDSQITPVPEPETYGALMLAAGAGLVFWRRRRCPG